MYVQDFCTQVHTHARTHTDGHTHTHTHTHIRTHIRTHICTSGLKTKFPMSRLPWTTPVIHRTETHTIFGNSRSRKTVTVSLHGQLTNALLAKWLLATRDMTEDIALFIRPNPPLPPANNAPVVIFGRIHLQNMSQAY